MRKADFPTSPALDKSVYNLDKFNLLISVLNLDKFVVPKSALKDFLKAFSISEVAF